MGGIFIGGGGKNTSGGEEGILVVMEGFILVGEREGY